MSFYLLVSSPSCFVEKCLIFIANLVVYLFGVASGIFSFAQRNNAPCSDCVVESCGAFCDQEPRVVSQSENVIPGLRFALNKGRLDTTCENQPTDASEASGTNL